MRTSGARIPLRFAAILLICAGPLTDARSAEPCDPPAGKVVSVQGRVEVSRAGASTWQQLQIQGQLCPLDRVRVGDRSRAAIRLQNETVIRLDQGTVITFSALAPDKPSWLQVLEGALHFMSRVPRSLDIKTPFVNAAIEGTEFAVAVGSEQTEIWVFEGSVLAANASGQLRLGPGETAVARSGSEPVRRVVVNPRDAVRWALYYPPLVDFAIGATQRGRDDALTEALDRYRRGDMGGAFAALESVPAGETNPEMLTLRASMLLSVGRLTEASADIERLESADPRGSAAPALSSVVETALGNTAEGLRLASLAVANAPDSPSAHLALSYAEQARFELQRALSSARRASDLASDSGLARARVAELELSLGELGAALDAAQQAMTLNPDVARTQTVLGFAYLSQARIGPAREAFQAAIRLDQADPLPRLGLGLAKIRGGNLMEGREDIETAASLDPNDALMRSYLGKAYFDERRQGPAASELAIAKSLDPNDPTPWFYDAIRKQTENRPVEALFDLQRSIELNDNRAVYRSRLLLDDDLAARSASVGRIYVDLGFEQRALAEGWKSVNTDPGNYSAHRLLADTYSALPRHEIARASEVLQSQLLQPLNVTPIQPRLAEADLLTVEGAGPTDTAFNEFNPLFVRDGLALQASGIAGSNDTYGDEITQSGVFGRYSYSLGRYHFETDGVRENNDLDVTLYDAFAQTQLGYGTSIQAEVRHSDREQGQLDLLFGAAPLPALRRDQEETTYRAGFRHAFSPASTVLANLSYQDVRFQERRTSRTGADIDLERDRDGVTLDLQHQLRRDRVDFITGLRYLNQDFTQNVRVQLPSFLFQPPFPPNAPPILVQPPPSRVPEEREQILSTSLYGYTMFEPVDNLTLIGGLSLESFKRGRQVDREKVNPKLGFMWEPVEGTTIRGSATRVLNATRFFTQTLEPTQVAGFNQFFDSIEGSDAWRYGIAVDQTLARDLFAGAEFSVRRADAPLLGDPGDKAPFFSSDEKLGRAYLYWAPHARWALRAEYQYERLENDPQLTQVVVDSTTHIVPLGASYFDPRGFSFHVNGTYAEQTGDFDPDEVGSTTLSGGEDFWVVDTRLDYRLPKRRGLISVGVQNLFDQDFKFQDTDASNPRFLPDRFVFIRGTLSFH